jgi:paired amphipathic helix protein Sin3a
MHLHPSLPSLPQTQLHAPPPPHAPSPPVVPAPPEVFFDRAKRALDDRDAWEEFLKLLSLFSTEVIEQPMLLQLAAPFLGGQGSELESQFRDILGLDRVRKSSTGEMPKAAGHAHGYGHPTGMGTAYLSGSKYRYGPSYRRLPDSVSVDVKMAALISLTRVSF